MFNLNSGEFPLRTVVDLSTSCSSSMSTQTGIRPDDRLAAFFGQCRGGRHRMIKVKIRNEAMVLDEAREAAGNWQQDWDNMVLPAVEEAEPCYILYRCGKLICFFAGAVVQLSFFLLKIGREVRQHLPVDSHQLVPGRLQGQAEDVVRLQQGHAQDGVRGRTNQG